MLKKLLSAIAYLALFLVATALFTYFLFPLDRLREYVEAKANLSSKYRLEIGSLEREGMGRLVLTDITLGVNRKLIRRKSPNAPAPVPVPAAKSETEDGDSPSEAEKPKAEAADEEATEEDEFTYIDIDRIAIDFDITDRQAYLGI